MMVENWRYQRALNANAAERDPAERNLQTFLDEEFITQRALEVIQMTTKDPPIKIPGIDRLSLVPDLVSSRPVPYLIEVIGMPKAGKTSSINKFLEQSWLKGNRQKVRFATEGIRTLPEKYQHFKHEDPFLYSALGASASFLSELEALKDTNQFTVLLKDRGLLDRRVFRRAMFIEGRVNPKIMEASPLFEDYLETPIFPIGGIIMCLIRPKISLEREGPRDRPGIVMNEEFLSILYEQYLRFHKEIESGEIAIPCYACLDMECPVEERLTKFHNTISQMISAKHH